jgi:hypothetical protein
VRLRVDWIASFGLKERQEPKLRPLPAGAAAKGGSDFLSAELFGCHSVFGRLALPLLSQTFATVTVRVAVEAATGISLRRDKRRVRRWCGRSR